MARTTTISYRLPRAVLVISGATRRTHDSVVNGDKLLADMPAKLVSHVIEVRHGAEPGTARTVTVRGGWLFQYTASFTTTEDGRLTKASSEATGAGSDLVSAGATLAGVALAVRRASVTEGAPDPHEVAYGEKHRAEQAERKELGLQRTRARQKQQALMTQMIDDPSVADVVGPQLWAIRDVQGALDERIQALDAVYEAWKTTCVTTLDEQFEVVVELGGLPTSLEGLEQSLGAPASETQESGPPKSLNDLWRRFGFTVVASWERRDDSTDKTPPTNDQKLVARIAEPVTLQVVEFLQETTVVTSRCTALVADKHSAVAEYELRRTLFGRRSLDVSFSTNGYLTGVAVEGTSALGEAAKALAGAPAGIASGVDSYTKVQTGVASARRAGLDARLAQAKAEVALRQQEVTAAGLDVTSADAARLEQLKQVQAILDAQSAIAKVDPSLVAEAPSWR